MSKRKLMIMGAGIYQVPLIKKAKRMGLETLVISIDGNYPGIPLADKFYAIDTRDKEKVLEIAAAEKISGICTSGTDVAVKTIGYVNERLGLKGISYDAACSVTDKAIMKDVFKKNGVSTAVHKRVYSLDTAIEAANEIGYPVIVKAVDSSGSRGIEKAENEHMLKTAYLSSRAVTKKEYILIEEYIVADEIGVDGYVGENDVEIILPHKKYTYIAGGVTIPSGHAFPYLADAKQIAEIEKQIKLAAKTLGLKNCPFNADVFVHDEKVWIIEMGGRTGATCIPELISIHKNYDWYEKVISASLGESVDFKSDQEIFCMAKLLFSEKSGVIKSIDQNSIDRLMKKGIDIRVDYQVGDQVEAVHNGTDRIGHVIGTNITEDILDEYVKIMQNAIELL